MIKDKQLEIINDVLNKIKQKYPEAVLGKISYGPKDTWVDIIVPDEYLDEDELDDIIASNITDIIVDYGYMIEFHPTPKSQSSSSN